MNVLHIAPSLERKYGGPTTSLAGYVRAAQHFGAAVTVAVPACKDADLESFTAAAGDVHIRQFRYLGRGAFVVSPGLVRWVSTHASRFDVVHAHGLLNPVSSFGARAALGRRAALVVRPFGTLSRYTFTHRRTALKNAYFRAVDRPILESARMIHFTSDSERAEAAWHGVDFTNRSRVVPPALLSALQVGRPAMKVTGRRVLFMSRLDPVKNLECLIDAWAVTRRIDDSAELVIAGGGSAAYVSTLRHRTAVLNLGDSVTFVGHVESKEKAALLADATLFVLPSLHENFGVAVLEAIAGGVPVLISPQVQLAPFVTRHRVGIVVRSDPSSLGKAMASALNDDALHDRVRTAGPALVSEEFSAAAVGRNLCEMYEAAASRRPERSGTATC